MRARNKIRDRGLVSLLILFAVTIADPQQRPQLTIDLKQYGPAADLFTDQSGSKYPQRGILAVFWASDDTVAVAFSTNRRWSEKETPETLHIRLLIFDVKGVSKPPQIRDWSFSADGPEVQTTLEIIPGPDSSILAVHQSTAEATGKIPEGDLIQVLNFDASLRQDFYVPATSAWVFGSSSDSRLVLQTYYADRHTSLTWWSGHLLKPGTKVDLPPGKEDLLAGPEVAARPICPIKELCTGIYVYRPGAPPWIYTNPSLDAQPIPQSFLSPTSLLVELRDSGDPEVKHPSWLIAHLDGSETRLPELPKGLKRFNVAGVSGDGQRFAVDAQGEAGLCGALNLYCKEIARAVVIDVPANRIVFEQSLSTSGGMSSLSPDGKQLAIFDRNKLAIYQLPEK